MSTSASRRATVSGSGRAVDTSGSRTASGRGVVIELPAGPVGDRILAAVEQAVGAMRTESEIADVLADAVHLTPPLVLQALAAREEIIRHVAETYGLLTSAEVAEIGHTQSKNTSEFASRMARNWTAIAIRRGRVLRYPGFQFAADGRPRPALAEVFGTFRNAGWDQESVVLWFAGPSARLGGEEPAAMLDSDLDAVVDAALDAAAVA